MQAETNPNMPSNNTKVIDVQNDVFYNDGSILDVADDSTYYNLNESISKLENQDQIQREELKAIKEQNRLVILQFALLIILIVFLFIQARKIDQRNNTLIAIAKSRIKESETLEDNIDSLKELNLTVYDDENEKNVEANDGLNETGKTPLSSELILELNAKLNKHIKDKFYLNSEITINTLASDLGTNRYYLSQVIQLKYKTNFNHFLNDLRVKEIIMLFEQNENQKYTLEGLSQEVGFNSVSTFSRAFKRYTGLSPRLYLSNMTKV